MSTVRHSVRIDAPARLHLGFLDPDGTSGRRFGSIGLAIEGRSTVVEVTPAEELEVSGVDADRARRCTERVVEARGIEPGFAVRVCAAPPSHAGLGSGTQLALATGAAIVGASGGTVDVRALAATLGRGRRSGIGLGLFEKGGLLVDGGRGSADCVPPAISRLAFPDAWRVVLVLDHRGRGLSGRDEVDAFAALAPMPADAAARLCHTTLLRLLPAVAEADFDAFSLAVDEIQAAVGDYFADAQGGGRFTSPRVAAALEHARAHEGLRGVGQSSWGPTGFAFVENASRAQRIADALRAGAEAGIEIQVCRAANRGAALERIESQPTSRLAAG